MLRAELRDIRPNDYEDWKAFAAAEHPEPWDEFAWFVLEIGAEGQEGSNLFQILVATHAAVPRAKGTDTHRRVLVVDSFEPKALETALRSYISLLAANNWDQIVERLRTNMYWEFERHWS
jgi:hypothetical protein